MSIIFRTRLDDFVYGIGRMAAIPGSRARAGGNAASREGPHALESRGAIFEQLIMAGKSM